MQDADRAAVWDERTFERVLEQLKTEGTIHATGVDISAERFTRIMEAIPEDPDSPQRRLFKEASFAGVTFEGVAWFNRATFEGTADFTNATFRTMAQFDIATFEGFATFDGAVFEDDAHFKNATFNGPETMNGRGGFQGAVFKGDARFFNATFNCGPRFDSAIFEGVAEFLRTTFKGHAVFGGATFKQGAVFLSAQFEDATFEGKAVKSLADFSGATFGGGASFSSASFEGGARFSRATFKRDRGFGPVRAAELLAFDGTVFEEPITLSASASMLNCSTTQFRRGADIFVRRAEIVLDDADFAEPSMLAPLLDPMPGEEPAVRERLDSDEEPAPRLVSLRRTKAGNLTITGVDLRACRFEGAHGLDRLRLERVRFAETPSGWQRSKRWRVPIRWTRRLAIAEEHHWRAKRAAAGGWYGPEVRAPSAVESVPPTPEQIAGTYRALRKAREDSKDEPGAADFYYGEMEMRRQGPGAQAVERPAGGDAATEQAGSADLAVGPVGDAGFRPAPRGERLILWLYWLVSGYGLRASRALIALALTVVAFAVLFDLWGFRPDQGFGRALIFSVASTSSLFRAPETEGFTLTAGGEVLQIILRLLGPLFFGLALLSLRGRVKR